MIPKGKSFQYLRSIIHKDRKIEKNENHWIRAKSINWG